MIVNITQIDNDYFIPISDELLDRCGFTDKVSIKVENETIVISKSKKQLHANKNI